jgi:hypothetical protein
MRVTLHVIAAAAIMLLGLRVGEAYYPANPYQQGPWCAVESLGFGTVTENCGMRTFEQCRLLTIAGNRGYCIPNPRWVAPYALSETPRRVHKRRIRHH